MVNVGDIAVKLAGRDAGQICVVIEVKDNRFVVIEGNTRRKKCNIQHLEFLNKQLKIKKDATREEVLKGLKESGIKFKDLKKGKSKERKERQLKLKKQNNQNSDNKGVKPKIVNVEKNSKNKKTK